MGEKTGINWTDSTWTPIRARRKDTGKVGVHCERVSEACKNCYAAAFNRRNLPSHGTGLDFTIVNREKVDIFLDEKMLLQPLRWKRGRKIFVNSQTDTFAEFVPDDFIDRVFAVMALCPQHTFQVLTKRPERMQSYLADPDRRYKIELEMYDIGGDYDQRTITDEQWPLPWVWLGVTAETQEWADKRIPLLLQTPAAVRFVSVEPMLGPVDFRCHPMFWKSNARLHWVITGGESGPHARPSNPQWFRDLRDQCRAAGVSYHHKQNGEFASVSEVAGPGRHHTFEDGRTVRRVGKKAAGRLLDGVEHNEFPVVTHG